jgi:hypothetical protein
MPADSQNLANCDAENETSNEFIEQRIELLQRKIDMPFAHVDPGVLDYLP